MFGKKSGVDIIDYTDLEKRGFIKKQPEKKSVLNVDKYGLIDLTKNENNLTTSAITPQPTLESVQTNPFSFLDNPSPTTQTSFLEENKPLENLNEQKEIQSLKIKIDDLDYKLEQFIQKIDKIESKLIEFERKTMY